nr:PREDICTED: sodium channel modifier 1 [Struthio camelus australis]
MGSMYTCTVCAHRPIFDTLDVLAVHRAGKKHVASLQSFYGRKHSLENEVQKRQHEKFVRAEEAGTQGSPAPLLVRTRRIAQSALLKAAPYSSCCRRMGVNGNGSRAGMTQTELSTAPVRIAATASPEPRVPSQKIKEAVGTTPVALLPGCCSGRADVPKAATTQTQQGGKGKASPSPASQPEALNPKRRQALERYLQLRSAGWIQDHSGKWVKDENAHVESAEDEPPVLLPA